MREPGRTGTPYQDREDVLLAQGYCALLGLGPATNIRRLTGGRSGSPVLALDVGGDRLVVKMTTQPDRLARADLESRLLRSDGALDGLAPELSAAASGSGWVAIATRECSALGPARQIDHPTWLAVSRSLAALHQSVVDLASLPVREPYAPVPDDGQLETWFTLGAGDDAVRGSRRLAEPLPDSLPRVLEHGDSHLDNVLRDPTGALVWIDWQEARIGDGLADLVFLWQRAEFAGARPPRAMMTSEYARMRRLDPHQLQPLLDRVELGLLLHGWPPFLAHG